MPKIPYAGPHTLRYRLNQDGTPIKVIERWQDRKLLSVTHIKDTGKNKPVGKRFIIDRWQLDKRTSKSHADLFLAAEGNKNLLISKDNYYYSHGKRRLGQNQFENLHGVTGVPSRSTVRLAARRGFLPPLLRRERKAQ